MPKFTTDITDAQASTYIKSPVTERHTPDLAEPYTPSFAQQMVMPLVGAGVSIFKRNRAEALAREEGQAVMNLTGYAAGVDEVGPGPLPHPYDEGPTLYDAQTERLKQINEISNLTQLTAAMKAGQIPQDVARTKAGALLRKAINQNPMYAPEIRKAFGNFFKSSLDTSLFKAPPKTAVQREQEKFAAQVERDRLIYGGTSADAADRLRIRTQQEDMAAELKNKASLSENEINARGRDILYHASHTLTEEIMVAATSGDAENGKLLPEQMSEVKAKFSVLYREAEREFRQDVLEATGRPPSEAQMKDFDISFDRLKKDTLELATTKGLANSLKENNELLRLNRQSKNELSYGHINTVKDLLGQEGVKTMLEMAKSPAYAAGIKESNPQLHEILTTQGGLDRLQVKVLKTIAAEPGTPEAKDPQGLSALAPLVGDPKVASAVKDKLVDIIETEPMALSHFNTNKMQRAIETGFIRSGRGTTRPAEPVSLDDVSASVESAVNRKVKDYYSENLSILSNIKFKERTNIRRGGRSFSIVDQDGKPVDRDTYSVLLEVKEIGDRYPKLWEGEYETSIDYVEALISGMTKQPKSVLDVAREARKLIDGGDIEGAFKVFKEEGIDIEELGKQLGLTVREPIDDN